MPRLLLKSLVGIALVALATGVGLPAQGGNAPSGAAPQGAAGPAGRGGTLTVPPGGLMFVQLSDTQFGFSNNDLDFIQDTVNAEFAVATVNRLKPAFVIVTGDLVNKPGDPAQIAEYQRVMSRLDKSIPLYNVAGNHDVENEPTAASIAAYRKIHGRDYYTFTAGPLLGIVLNSSVIHSPAKVPEELSAQDAWLRTELGKARASGVKHVVVFQHHPWFLERADEPDQYFNIPLLRRTPMLELFKAHGVRYLVSGHLHRTTEATGDGLTSIVTGPVGRPLGGQSGFRIFVVTDTDVVSRYYAFGEMPYQVGPAPARGRGTSTAPATGRGPG